jgi:lysophospholipase L1-like esterase
LFAHAATDQKNITFVGYDTANPPSAAALNALGSASSKYVNKHEGHFAWTVQQVDDLITGVSKSSQDGVNYTGKKIVADAQPQIVLVHLGTNDMQQTPAGATDRLAKLIDHVVTDAPNALIVVASIIPLPSQASNVTAFNQAIPGIVKTRADTGKHVIFVDQYAGFVGKTGLMDSVHPYEAGYEQMAVVWYAAIKPYLH